jgi:transposase
MITAGAEMQVLVATQPVDFRKQADGLAAIVQAALGADPFCGTIYVFRSKRMDRVKLLWWGRNRHLPDDQAAGERPVPLAADRGRDDEADGGAARDASRRRPVGERRAPRRGSSECHTMSARHDDSGLASMLHEPPESATLWLVLGKAGRAVPDRSDTLPNDIDALRALILAERAAREAVVAERDKLAARNERLEAILAEIRRAHFGRKSERINDDQLSLALEELETALAKAEVEDEKTDPALKAERTKKRRASRNESLDHLPHEEMVVEPDSKACPCCGGALHVIGEDTSKRLDKVPAQVRVIVTRRPKYACRTCEKTGADEVAGIV